MKLEGGDTLKKRLKDGLKKLTQEMAEDYEKYIKKYTPVAKDTKYHKGGTAQRGWRLKKTTDGFKLDSKVPYIGYLEDGWSKQAKSGMTKPATRDIQAKMQSGKYKMNKKRK